MESTEHSGMRGFQTILEWIVRLAYLNILWILYSLIGLGIFGIGPATISLFAVVRKINRDGTDISIWKEFNYTYRSNFLRANGLMLVLIPIYVFIYMNYAIIRILPASFLMDNIVFPAVVILSILIFVLTCYLFAVFVHFELSFWGNFKHAFLVSIVFPLHTVTIVFTVFIFSIIVFLFPAVSIFYLISVPTLIIQMCALKAFGKLPSQERI